MPGSRVPASGVQSFHDAIHGGAVPSVMGGASTPGPIGIDPTHGPILPTLPPSVLTIDPLGRVIHPRIKNSISSTLGHGPMNAVHGIIVHQTGGSTAKSTLQSYALPKAKGAHFLIDKNGDIYQTASVLQRTYHVGPLKARCVLQATCTPTEIAALRHQNVKAENRRENAKSVPDRFPSNEDAIGIEIVGATLPNGVYESVTPEQNASLKWLIGELSQSLGIPMTEIFRHPDVSRKTESEASTARW